MIPVKDVMTTDVITFHQDTAVQEIAALLSTKHFTGAPVVDEGGHVVGIVSEVDIFTKKGRTAKDIMSKHVISISEETGIDAAARLLANERIRRLPVLSQGRMVGLISRSDVLDFFSHSQWTCATCGNAERGLEQPDNCDHCGGTQFRLERTAPGS